MYFIELLVKKFQNKGQNENCFDPMDEETREEETCEHIFMPIDSTGETLACKHCGLVVNHKNLKDINFFRRHNQPGS